MVVARVVPLVKLSHRGRCIVVLQKSGFRSTFVSLNIYSLLSWDGISPFPAVFKLFEALNFLFIW